MQKVIEEKLKEIEQREKVRILHCVESGSRAWGFASPDSDYDVRFVYVRTVQDYLRLDRSRDVIQWQLDDTLDINGWDLKKLLQLMHKSNPTVFEWDCSPIVYKTTEGWEKLRPLINEAFMARHGLYHYLSMAEGNYREYLRGDTVRLKKYFYVLRPLLACRWILKYGTPPPMAFDSLAADSLPPELMPEVERLLAMKRASSEMAGGARVQKLNDYIEEGVDQIRSAIDALPADEPVSWEKLNEMFIGLVGEYAPQRIQF